MTRKITDLAPGATRVMTAGDWHRNTVRVLVRRTGGL